MAQTITLRVTRYLGKDRPNLQTFEVPFQKELTVLDALNEIKQTQDGSLTFRWSCRMGICGSCGMMVNGRPRLTCETYVRDLREPIVVSPLRNFPIIKDLVCDIDDVMEKFRSVMPYFDRSKEKPITEGEYLQTPKERESIRETSRCIKCMLCYSACPVYGLDKNFIGPAAGALAYRYHADSRENGALGSSKKRGRIKSVIGKDGVWKCSFVGECSVVCPKRVDPAMALQRLKLKGAMQLLK